ncbi:L-2-amino-thiazoline-4-carboxylic acid hydrolase [Haloferax sp. S1W]|uniref:L-2-amino-thiazoline-4-carboxylic acid hydrolase n=1 Tax=Haloferax sp. S1W TaxID=3377110 RepID=UPI0037C5A982
MSEQDAEPTPREQLTKAFHEAEKLDTEGEPMESVVTLDTLLTIHRLVGDEVGAAKATALLAQAFLLDPVLDAPEWNPDQFDFRDADMERAFKRIFDDLTPFICLYERLRTHLEAERTQRLMTKAVAPVTLPYLGKTFTSHPEVESIDAVRRDMGTYLGTGDAFEWTEQVSDDGREVKYRFDRCGYVEVLQAYGLHRAASMVCYCDHIHFDTHTPELYFEREHSIGSGDDYCDHHFILRSPDEEYDEDARYGDTNGVEYDARAMIRDWETRYEKGDVSW